MQNPENRPAAEVGVVANRGAQAIEWKVQGVARLRFPRRAQRTLQGHELWVGWLLGKFEQIELWAG